MPNEWYDENLAEECAAEAAGFLAGFPHVPCEFCGEDAPRGPSGKVYCFCSSDPFLELVTELNARTAEAVDVSGN